MNQAAAVPVGDCWRASLDLSFHYTRDATRLTRARHAGPLRVQRTFYPEGKALCHTYLLHPPGGLVSGDELNISVKASPGARVLLTTPSAGKVYRASMDQRLQHQNLTAMVSTDASLEWLPQETILFNGARTRLTSRFDLAANGRLIAWEILCLGRPAINERFQQGSLQQRLAIYQDNQPRFIDLLRLKPDSALADSQWGLQGQPVCGTLVLTLPSTQAEASYRPIHEQVLQFATHLPGESRLAATRLDNLCIIRYLGPSSAVCRETFIRCWQYCRPRVMGKPASIPRIWYT